MSSSHRRVSVGLIFVESACVFGKTETLNKACGNVGTGMFSGFALSLKESPVTVSFSFATLQISPACTVLTLTLSLPTAILRLPKRSSTDCTLFQILESADKLPE